MLIIYLRFTTNSVKGVEKEKNCVSMWLYKTLTRLLSTLTNVVDPYEYIDCWERFDDYHKDSFLQWIKYRRYYWWRLYTCIKCIEELKIKNLGEYHDLYVQSDTLLLADVFENFRNKCTEIYELDPAHFLSAPGLAWKVCLKKTGVKLELLTDTDMLLMIEIGIRGGMSCNT